MSELRNEFLKLAVGAETIVVDFPKGERKVEVRERTVSQQFDLIEKARKSNGDLDSKLLNVETIIATVYDPDTGDPIFKPADREHLMNSFPASVFNRLLNAANAAAGLGEDVETTAVRLKETSPDASSSS